MKFLPYLFAFLSVLFLVGCETTDGALKEQGKSPSYIMGFHDGRHSGLKEQGNNYEYYIRDENKFNNDVDYKEGWLAGEIEGKNLQIEIASFGNEAAGVYTDSQNYKNNKKNSDIDKVAKDAVKNADTTGLDELDN